jgi:hypothetical protein
MILKIILKIIYIFLMAAGPVCPRSDVRRHHPHLRGARRLQGALPPRIQSSPQQRESAENQFFKLFKIINAEKSVLNLFT